MEGGSFTIIPVDKDDLSKGVIVLPPLENNKPDLDCDGIADSVDEDMDGDGVNNAHDAFPNNPSESIDTDGDGIGNNSDTDDDNDGYTDEEENELGSDPLDPESIPNHAPVAVEDNATTDEDTMVSIAVLANDTDVDTADTLSVSTVTAVTTPANGTVVVNGTNIEYTPAANFNGTDTFDYTVNDGTVDGNTVTVTVTVNAVNDAPVAVADNATTDEDTMVSIAVLANDTDVDTADTLSVSTVTVVTTPANGTVEINGTNIEYTPAANFNGTDTFDYTVNDGTVDGNTVTVTVTVNAVVDGPIALDDDAAVITNSTVAISVLNNDTHPDGLAMNITGATTPSSGAITIGTETITYTPGLDFTGTDSFVYTISDGTLTDTATVTIIVNDLPIAQDDIANVDEDSNITIAVMLNDSDAGVSLTITNVTTPSNGTVDNNGTHITYTPNADFNGTDSFEYTITDDNGATDTAEVNVTVNNVNDAPIAVDDNVSTQEDTNITIDVLGNDSDIDGNHTISISNSTLPSNGQLVISSAQFMYVPAENFVGTDSFTYTIIDGSLTATATVTVTVNAVNDAPVAVDDSNETDEDTMVSIEVLANDTDVDGDTLSIASVGTAANGTAVVNGTNIEYTPNANYNGTDTFDYNVTDGNGEEDTATVTLTVNAVNDAPVAVDDNVTTNEDRRIIIEVLANDTDVDGDTLTVSIGNPTDINGSITMRNNNTRIRYIPDADFFGTISFDYNVSDGNGGVDTATVTVTVNAVNDAPVAVDDNVTTDEDRRIIIDVLANDTDVEGDTLTVSIGNPTDINGRINVRADNKIRYRPDVDFFGTISFDYNVSDGNGGVDTATVTVTVNAVNDAPVAVDDSNETDEDTMVSIAVLANDTDVDGDTLSIASVGTATNGTAIVNGTNIEYTPAANFNGTDTFDYNVTDGNGEEDTATVTVTVNAVNDAPVAEDDSNQTNQGTPITIEVLANDTDVDGDTLTVTIGNPADINGSIATDGSSIIYTPDAAFFGTISFDYNVSDGNGGVDTATVTIEVIEENIAPIAVDDNISVNEDANVTIDVLNNDTDGNGDTLTITGTTNPANGSVVIENNATIIYIPDAEFNSFDSFEYTIVDGNGGTDTAEVNITIVAVSDAPIAVDDNVSTVEDTNITIDVLANDSDADNDSITILQVTVLPEHGTVTVSSTEIIYAPDADYNGLDVFTYSISDGNGNMDTAEVNITVTLGNDVPMAVDDNSTTEEDTEVVIAVLENDIDIDGDALVIASVTNPSNGAVDDNGTHITYIPNSEFNGTDSFDYNVSDGNGGVATATVTIIVSDVSDAPIAMDDTANTAEETDVIIAVLENDTDSDDAFTLDSYTQGSHGAVDDNGTHLTYTPNVDFNGTDTFSYTIIDTDGNTDEANVTVTVGPVNDAPSATDDTITTQEDAPVVVYVLTNDTDTENDELTITASSIPSSGSSLIAIDAKSITYTPNSNFNGDDSFTYTISDGNGGTSTATVNITVGSTNDAPIAVDQDISVDEDSEDNGITLEASDTEDASVDLNFTVVVDPSNGTLSGTGADLTYTPNENFYGIDNFTFQVQDTNGSVDTAEVNITVNSVNDVPVAEDQNITLNEDTNISVTLSAIDADANDTLVYTVEVGDVPSNGTLSGTDENLTYTPDGDFNGTDSFTFTVTDGDGETDTGVISITVENVNDAPLAVDDADSVFAGGSVEVVVLDNDTDVEGDTLTITNVTTPDCGEVIIGGNTITYSDDSCVDGTYTFDYEISDGNGGTDTATVEISTSTP